MVDFGGIFAKNIEEAVAEYARLKRQTRLLHRRWPEFSPATIRDRLNQKEGNSVTIDLIKRWLEEFEDDES